jgi:hypothetical protein
MIKVQDITLRGRVGRREWLIVWAVTIGVIIVNTLPYAYAYLTAPADKQFMGIMINVPDHSQYFSWFKQYLTANLAANILTPEPNTPIFFNLLWWLLAKLGAMLGWDYAAMFQILRVTATAAFMLLTYQLCAWFLDEPLARLTAFLLAVFSAGFGWALIVLKYLFNLPEYPLEISLLIFIVEPNSFFSMLSTPHLTGAALYMFAFDLVLRGEVRNQLRYAVSAGLWTQFMGWQHGYDLFLVWGILGGYGLFKLARDRCLPPYLFKAGLIIGLLSAWPGLYSFALTSVNPIWREVLAQFDNAGVFTPAPWLLPVLLGPGFFLALFTVIKNNPLQLQRFDDRALFLMAWFAANFLLVYLPTDYQIKMLNGWQVPIAILATQGLFAYVLPWFKQLSLRNGWRWRSQDLRRGLAVVLLACVIPTNLYLWAWRFLDLGRHSYPYFLSRDELAAMQWLAQNTPGDSVVLSSLTTGQYVPMLTGRRAFLAHWAQTVDFHRKTEMLSELFSAQVNHSRRQTILHDYQVDYILIGPAEQALGNLNPETQPNWSPAFSVGPVTVFRVEK